MLKQHQVDKVFGALVTAVHMTRAGVAQSPLLGYALVAGFSVSVMPAVQPLMQPMVESIAQSEMANSAGAGVRLTMQAVEAGLRSMAPEASGTGVAVTLTREQLRVAQYAATKYNVSLAEVQKYVALAFDTARQQRVDPMLVVAVMAIESNFRPTAKSPVGAQGLMQVHMAAHKNRFEALGGRQLATDPAINIVVGVQILKEYLVRTSSNELALKQYVGAANHDNDGGYGYKVLSERERILAAAAGRPIPAVPLKAPEWLLAKWQAAKSAVTSGSGSSGTESAKASTDNVQSSASPTAGEAARASEVSVPAVITPPEEKAKDAAADGAVLKVSLSEK